MSKSVHFELNHIFGDFMFFRLFSLLLACGDKSNRITIQGFGDEFETQVKVNTYSYSRPFVIAYETQDVFFRAYISKTDKSVDYQLYATVNSGTSSKYWDSARFKYQGALIEKPLSRVSFDVDCSQYGCIHYEDILLHLDRSTLESWLQRDATIRISSSKVSGTQDMNVDRLEVLEFLKKVDLVLSKM